MNLIISPAPHLKSKIDTPYIMRQVIFALIPAVIASVIFFKYYAVSLILNCMLSAILTEEIILKLRNKPSCFKDGSAALTGLLLALILPPSTKWYGASLGSVFAVFIGKQIFGGLGCNIFNPALIGRAFLVAAYPKMLTTFINPFAVDTISKATPLALRKFNGVIIETSQLFLGNISGSLGETCALGLIIGGIYLLVKKIADWRIPITMVITISVISIIMNFINPLNGSILFHFFSGGVLLGIFFMATDPVTTPVTKKGRYVFGIGAATLIMIIRYWGGLPEGTMYAILFMNALTPLINKYTKPARFK